MEISKPMTPAVEAIARLNITGNVTPHVWYVRSEFRTDRNRPNRNMITALADIVYWYRPREVRDEENGGAHVGYERKFQRDMLQYDYGRRAAVFGMSEREMREACLGLSKVGLVRIDYRTERYKGRLLHNVVYIEPIAEAVARTLTGPNVEVAARSKGATRGRHVKRAEDGGTPAGNADDAGHQDTGDADVDDAAGFDPDSGIDDQTPDGSATDALAADPPPATPPAASSDDPATSQNFETLAADGTSQNFETSTSQNFGGRPPKFWDTYHETSVENSSSREFRTSSSSTTLSGDARATPGADDDDPSADAGTAVVARPSPAAASEAPPLSDPAAQGQGDRPRHATGGEEVPRPAAGLAILGLTPVPRAELEARPARDALPWKDLRALMSCTDSSRVDHLRQQLALGTASGIPRDLYLRLTDEEVTRATRAAQADARVVKGNFAAAGYHALDTLIGEQFTAEFLTTGRRAKAAAPQEGGGRAAEVKNAGKVITSDEPAGPPVGSLRAGAMWRHKVNQDLVMIRRVDGFRYTLSTGQTVKADELARQYEFEAAPTEATA